MGKINTVHKDRFNVWNASGQYITGLVKADFDILLHNQDRVEVSSTIPVGITEMESGLYESDFTPTSEGIYSLKLHNSDYFPTSLLALYEVDDSSFDTIEDKIDIIDGNVDLILEDTSGLEANLTSYISGKTNEISGYISDHNTNLNSNFDTLSGIINTSESNIRGSDNDDLKILSDQIDTIQDNIIVIFSVPTELNKPASSTRKYVFILEIFDTSGNIEVPDSTPIFKLEYADGTVIIGETYMSSFASGQYYYEYNLPYDKTAGTVLATAKLTENSITRYYRKSTLITDAVDVAAIASDIVEIKDDINTLESEMSRALGLMQENQKIVTLTKSITGKMLTGIKYLYTDNTMLVEVAVYDITVTYDTNDQAILFLSTKRT